MARKMTLWILLAFVAACLFVRLVLIISNCVTNEIARYTNNGTKTRAEGALKNQIVNQHLQLLFKGKQHSFISNREPFSRYLSTEETSRMERCHKMASDDFQISTTLWTFQRSNKLICVDHHVYLKENNTVLIEVGGNLGKDSSYFALWYKPRHLILEPVTKYADVLREKFRKNSRITVLNFGLGKTTETMNIVENGEETSIFNSNLGNINISVINSTEFFENIGVGLLDVDLLTLDCEGCELDVIENLLETNMIHYFKNVQFKSHHHVTELNIPDYIKRYCMIQEYMARTHRLTFQYKLWWENWRRTDLE